MKPLFNKKMRIYLRLLIPLFLIIVFQSVTADDQFIKSTCKASFPESMSFLQELIKKRGYTISRIQHVDKGLRTRGYETGLYRVVFFGKKEDIKKIIAYYPALIPYIPLSITMFEESKQTGISTINPNTLYQLYKTKNIKQLIDTWQKDILSIFMEYSQCTI